MRYAGKEIPRKPIQTMQWVRTPPCEVVILIQPIQENVTFLPPYQDTLDPRISRGKLPTMCRPCGRGVGSSEHEGCGWHVAMNKRGIKHSRRDTQRGYNKRPTLLGWIGRSS